MSEKERERERERQREPSFIKIDYDSMSLMDWNGINSWTESVNECK